jgi:hypothetical protein
MRCRLLTCVSLAAVYLLASWPTSARAAEPADLSGRWHGAWLSCQTGHHGHLSARFCKVNDTCYRVHFTGSFWVVIPFRFTVNLAASERPDGTVVLSGSPRLPFFGTFDFVAVATDQDFQATYSTARDHGQFTLHR